MNAVLQALAEPGPAANHKKRRFDQVSDGALLKTQQQPMRMQHRDTQRRRQRAGAAAASHTQRKQERQKGHTIPENGHCEDLYAVHQLQASRLLDQVSHFGPVDSDGQGLRREFLVSWVDRHRAENEWVAESRLRDPDDLDSSEKVDDFLARRTDDHELAEEVESAVMRICELVAKESATARSQKPRPKTNQCAAESRMAGKKSEQKEEEEKPGRAQHSLAVRPITTPAAVLIAGSKDDETVLDSNQSAEGARAAVSQAPGTCVSARVAEKHGMEPVQRTKRKRACTSARAVIE